MIEKQVHARADVSKSLKPDEKEKLGALKARLAELAKEKPPEPPRAMAMTDLPEPPPTHLFKRGNWQKPGRGGRPGVLLRDRRPRRRRQARQRHVRPPRGAGELGRVEGQPAAPPASS
jgi:hypothetical protein